MLGCSNDIYFLMLGNTEGAVWFWFFTSTEFLIRVLLGKFGKHIHFLETLQTVSSDCFHLWQLIAPYYQILH